MTKEKALYQAKLIIDNLSEEEYNFIPKDMIKYIEENMEYDENITVNPMVPLENQNIDNMTYNILEDILNKIDLEKLKEIEESEENEHDFMKKENNKLRMMNQALQKENEKILQIKDLLQNYKTELSKKNCEIEDLKAQNQKLYNSIKKAPWIVRKMFFKDFENKLLKE